MNEVLKKIREDLEWRGPNGHPMRYIVLPREMAQQLLASLEQKPPQGNPDLGYGGSRNA